MTLEWSGVFLLGGRSGTRQNVLFTQRYLHYITIPHIHGSTDATKILRIVAGHTIERKGQHSRGQQSQTVDLS